jgi:hypothetical protein
MRLSWLRCLVVLLALALASGNAHALHGLSAVAAKPCEDDKAGQSHHHEHGGVDAACCCDCLSCTPASIPAPAAYTGPSQPFARIGYLAIEEPLSDRVLPPEPDPPRPGALR